MERAAPRPRTLRERLRNFSLRSLFSRRQAPPPTPRPIEISVSQRISVYGTSAPGGAVSTEVTPNVAGPQPVPVAQRRPTAHDQRMGRTAVAGEQPQTREGSPVRAQVATSPGQANTPGRSRR
jgi:hypothetical protein